MPRSKGRRQSQPSKTHAGGYQISKDGNQPPQLPAVPTSGDNQGAHVRDGTRANQSETKPSKRWWGGQIRLLRRTIFRLGTIEAFTCILAISTMVQVWAFIQSERSSIAILGVSIPGFPQTLPKAIYVLARNGGRATANIVEIVINDDARIGPLPAPPVYLPMEASSAGVIVLPGGDRGLLMRPNQKQPPLNAGDALLSAVKQGSVQFRVLGYVRYKDEFSIFGQRTIGFCYVYNRAEDPNLAYEQCPDSEYIYSR